MLAPFNPPTTYWHVGGDIIARPSLPRFVDDGGRTSGPVTALSPWEAAERAEFYLGLMRACEAVNDPCGFAFVHRLADELLTATNAAMNWASAARGRAA